MQLPIAIYSADCSHIYIDKYYKYKDKNGRRYWLDNILGSGGAAKGNPKYEFLGVTRYWRYSKDSMEKLYWEGRIGQTEPGIVPREVHSCTHTPFKRISNRKYLNCCLQV